MIGLSIRPGECLGFVNQERWAYPVPVPSWVGTTMPVLLGMAPETLERWEDNYWELAQADPGELSEEDAQLIPFSCLLDLGLDIDAAARLPVNNG